MKMATPERSTLAPEDPTPDKATPIDVPDEVFLYSS